MKKVAQILGWAGAAMLLLSSVSAIAQSQDANLFARLNQIQAQRDSARKAAGEYELLVASLDEAIHDRKRRADVAQRAAGPVYRQMASILTRWTRELRGLNRGPRTDERSDAHHLLAVASVDAIEPRLDDMDVLTRAEDEKRTLAREVERRVRTTVVFAQERALGETREAEKNEVVRDARHDPDTRKDLQKTDESLHRSLSHMITNESKADFHRLKGTLIPPVAGAPVARFGPRPHGQTKVSTRHTGWTWQIAEGTPVKAASHGLVVYAHRFEGYGNLVIIDHGSGYHTLYAHLKKVDVEMGARVKRGTLLGKTGDTGSLEGPKLYFELRSDGRAIDPASWFVQHN